MKKKLMVVLFTVGCFTSFSCKKDPLDSAPVVKGRVLSYYDGSPLSNVTVNLYYTNGTPTAPDEVVTTDAMGFFEYKQVKDSLTRAIPSLSGWWHPFDFDQIIHMPGAFQDENILYLFKAETVKVNMHFKSPLDMYETGNVRLQNLINLPKLDSTTFYVTDESINMYSDTGTYVSYLSAVEGLDNELSFGKEVFGWNGYVFEEDSSITFLANPIAGGLVFDFYY